MDPYVDIVFDGPPSDQTGSFVEVEDHTGKSINFGEWIHREDGYWVLRLTQKTVRSISNGPRIMPGDTVHLKDSPHSGNLVSEVLEIQLLEDQKAWTQWVCRVTDEIGCREEIGVPGAENELGNNSWILMDRLELDNRPKGIHRSN